LAWTSKHWHQGKVYRTLEEKVPCTHWGGILETPAYAQQERRGQVEGARAFSGLGSQGVSRNASKRHARVVEVRAATASTAKPSDSSGMTRRSEQWTPRCMLPAASWQP